MELLNNGEPMLVSDFITAAKNYVYSRRSHPWRSSLDAPAIIVDLTDHVPSRYSGRWGSFRSAGPGHVGMCVLLPKGDRVRVKHPHNTCLTPTLYGDVPSDDMKRLISIVHRQNGQIPQITIAKKYGSNQRTYQHTGWTPIPNDTIKDLIRECLNSDNKSLRESGLALMGKLTPK